MSIALLLTQWKRNNLENQLKSIMNQTIHIDYIIVFQNEDHVNIDHLKSKYNFIHVKSDYNTKYFGRFAYLFSIPSDICIVMDDDILPGSNCIKNYVDQCVKKNGIIGGNGRICKLSPYKNKIIEPIDCGIRKSSKVDFVGHLWCFKKEWLYYMFAVKPYTYDTGEDMHFCFSSKILGGIESFVGEQLNKEDMCDVAMNSLASDQFASWRTTKMSLRKAVEQYWIDKGLKYITNN
tara:strand:- start:764 stop:1468 length:705 start_codon:yes stop_codon:yes gene_type:complete